MALTVPSSSAAAPASTVAPNVAAIQYSLLWLMGAGGGIVFIEPSPFELSVLLGIVFFTATGLRLRPMFLPLILMLVVLNTGYSLSAAHLLDDSKIINWILTSWYMAIVAIFFALVFAEDTAKRLEFVSRGYVVGAVIASLAGIAGYFHLVPGGDDLLTLYSRARGTFKDPNVLGAFLIFPALVTLQSVVGAPFAKALRSGLALGIISLAILLSFSRAAWGQLVATSGAMLVLMFFTAENSRQRTRIVTLTIAAIVCAAILVAILLSMDSIAGLFKERASFDQSYDTGRFGRFGRHVLGFVMALDLPLGIGPLQFSKYFPEDTHNSYLNAFMSGGWISGIIYPALTMTTVYFAARNVFVRTPWQRAYLAFFAAFVGTVGESFIIDTDHWRHFFLMLGAMWGLSVATREYVLTHPPLQSSLNHSAR